MESLLSIGQRLGGDPKHPGVLIHEDDVFGGKQGGWRRAARTPSTYNDVIAASDSYAEFTRGKQETAAM